VDSTTGVHGAASFVFAFLLKTLYNSIKRRHCYERCSTCLQALTNMNLQQITKYAPYYRDVRSTEHDIFSVS
jgi:hypothetical protein